MEKVIIIDFDNTIGYFTQVVYIFNIIEKIYDRKINDNDVRVIFELYPYSFRPKIFEILKFVQKQKQGKIISNFILYTKNKNENFVHMVISYIESYIGCSQNELFDDILFSKTKKKNFETLVTHKTYKTNTYFCFIDDKKYNYAKNNTLNVKIYYINFDAYKYNYSIERIIKIMNYETYEKINKKTLGKYLKNIYKVAQMTENVPRKIFELDSIYIFNLLNKFCVL